MSRQYSNRPFAPPRHRVSLQMCDYVPYPTAQTNDTSSDSSSWQLTDPLSCTHQPTTASSTTHSLSTPNDFSYFQYPHHRQTLDSSSLHSSNREATNNQPVHQRNESQPSCHFQYLQSHEEEPTRPLLPLNAVTAAANATASAPHHRHYRLESPSAASFSRRPPWFDDEREDNNGITPRSSHNNTNNSNNHNHSKRQRSSAISTSTSQSSHSYHHHERKRSRHEGINNENNQTDHHSQENASHAQRQQYRSSSHHHYQPYTNHRHVQPQPTSIPRTSYIDNVPSLSRPFDQRSQAIQRNRIEYPHEINNTNTHYDLHHRPIQPSSSSTTASSSSVQPRNMYHSSDHRQFLLESPPVALPRRQPIPPPRSSYNQQSNHHHPHSHHHHHRSGITFDPTPSPRGPLFHRTSMTTHLHQRPSPSFLTDLLHRVIDAHAASYSDNHSHFHHHHHHHPPTASIDLIAYAWMSPGHEIFSLPAAFSIQFGDFFDLTIPDETPVVGLTDSELERLPTMIYTKSCTTIQADDKCAVCLSEYIGGDKLKHLRCKHFFHSDCIDPWLKTSTRCPICRGEQTR